MFHRLHRHHHFGHGNKASSSHGSDNKNNKQSRSLYDGQGSTHRSAPSSIASQSRTNTGGSEPPLYIENQFRRRFPPPVSGFGSPRRGHSAGSINTSASRRVGSIDNNLMSSTVERGRSRRERTFVGSECTVCEEPLEHTLQGERILQFACSHAAHEACFYELIRECDTQSCPTCDAPLHFDTGRGGNVLDIKKISNMVRSANAEAGPAQAGRLAWDNLPARSASVDNASRKSSSQTLTQGRASQRSREALSERYDASRVIRNDGDNAAAVPHQENNQHSYPGRHELEAQVVEPPTTVRTMPRNPVPEPTVTIRSEFPSFTKSRQQQTFTCLVTIEVPDNKWTPDPEDIGLPPQPQPASGGSIVDERPASNSPTRQSAVRHTPDESAELLQEMTDSLRNRVDNWHGLDFSRFGQLRLYSTLRVGKDKSSWQELECYLFAEMLICVKEKKLTSHWDENGVPHKATRCTLKGSILVKKHLNEVTETGTVDENILTLNLSVVELPQFHLKFGNRNQLKLWHQALVDLNAETVPSPNRSPDVGAELPDMEEDNDWQRAQQPKGSSVTSSWCHKSATTAQTDYTSVAVATKLPRVADMHVPIDVVVVVPISASMQGVKINLVRDALRFIVNTLGERDRMGIVAFGSGGGGVPIVGMTTKTWSGWSNVLNAIKPVGQKTHRADVVEGANVAMDLLMQRKHSNPIANIMLISDASTSDPDSVDFVVSRAEAAKISIYSFGLGMTHKPDTMIELSTRTKASYTYVKDWMMLRECLAGCVGAMQTLSHQNVKLKLKLPEGSPAKFHKISGALQITKRATGRDAEASLGDLRFGDKRDVLIQLLIQPDHSSQEQPPQDHWDNIVEGLEGLGAVDGDADRGIPVEEVPLIQADVTWGDILRNGTAAQMPRPSLMAITMLPVGFNQKGRWQHSPPIPPHPSVVQRRMELLTSDMLTRALTLVSRGQHDRAHTLLNETRSILKGLGKGGLPPVPPSRSGPSTPRLTIETGSPTSGTPPRKRSPSPPTSAISATGSFPGSQFSQSRHGNGSLALGTGIDTTTVSALDAELESSLEWINHPAVFGRDSRKAVLQAIGVISSQRAFTFRSPIESLWADRVGGIKRLADRSREWREEGGGEGGITEET